MLDELVDHQVQPSYLIVDRLNKCWRHYYNSLHHLQHEIHLLIAWASVVV